MFITNQDDGEALALEYSVKFFGHCNLHTQLLPFPQLAVLSLITARKEQIQLSANTITDHNQG